MFHLIRQFHSIFCQVSPNQFALLYLLISNFTWLQEQSNTLQVNEEKRKFKWWGERGFSTMFQLCSGGGIYWWRRPEYRRKTPTCRLNGGGQQFYKYQQNEQPPLTSNQWTQKQPRHKALEYEVLTLGEHTDVAVLNRLLRYQPSHSR